MTDGKTFGYIVTARGPWVSPEDFANGTSTIVHFERVPTGAFGYVSAGTRLDSTFTAPETGWYEQVDGQWRRIEDNDDDD